MIRMDRDRLDEAHSKFINKYIITESSIKKCNKCNKIKNISEFHKRHDSKDGYSCCCRICTNLSKIKDYKKFYNNHKQLCKEKKKRYNNNNKEKVKEMYSSYRIKTFLNWLSYLDKISYTSCCLCGFNEDFSAIDMHHFSNKKTIKAGKAMGRKFNMDLFNILVGETIPLCANCHRLVHNTDVYKNYSFESQTVYYG